MATRVQYGLTVVGTCNVVCTPDHHGVEASAIVSLSHKCREDICPIIPNDLIQSTPLFDRSIVVHQ
eukprot:5977317-Pyramimonas_sp.AAC.1